MPCLDLYSRRTFTICRSTWSPLPHWLTNQIEYRASRMNPTFRHFSALTLVASLFSSLWFLFICATGRVSLYTEIRCVMISGLTPGTSAAVHTKRSTFLFRAWWMSSASAVAIVVPILVYRPSSMRGTLRSSSFASSLGSTSHGSKSTIATACSAGCACLRGTFLVQAFCAWVSDCWWPSAKWVPLAGITLPCYLLIHVNGQNMARQGGELHREVWGGDDRPEFVEAEGGVQLDVPLRADSFSRETDHVVVIGHHFFYLNPHCFEGLLVKNVDWASPIYQGLHDGEVIDVDRYHHQIVLGGVYPFEVIICKCYGWHPWLDGHEVHLMDNTQVLLPHTIRAPTPGKPVGDGVSDLAASSTVVFGRIVPPPAALPETIILPRPWRGAVSLPWCFLSTRGTPGGATDFHKATQVPCLNQLLYFFLQGLVLLGRMTGVLMVPTLLATVGIIRAQSPYGWQDQLALRASYNIFPLSVLRGVYRENRGPKLSHLGSPRPDPNLPCRSFSSFFLPLASARAWFLNWHSSSNCIDLAARRLSLSKLFVGCMHKLSAKGPGRRTVSIWCIATSGLRFRMLMATFSNWSMNFIRDSPFSWRMLTRAMDVRWWGRLVANWTSNLATSISKQSTEFGGSFMNQLKAPPFKEVGKTQHKTALYKLIWVVYTSMCSSGSVVPSYRSLLNPFHLSGRGASMTKSVKGWRRSVAEVLVVFIILLGWDSPSISRVRYLFFDSLSIWGPTVVAKDLPTWLVGTRDDPPSTNFFISWFSFQGFWYLLHLCQFLLESQHHCCLVCFGHSLSSHIAGWYHLLLLIHTILSAPRWAPIVLKRVWGLENNCSCLYLRSVTDAPSSLLHFPSFDRLAPHARVVPAEGTPTLKSVGVLALRCQSTVDNDVPFSLKCVLFILPWWAFIGGPD